MKMEDMFAKLGQPMSKEESLTHLNARVNELVLAGRASLEKVSTDPNTNMTDLLSETTVVLAASVINLADCMAILAGPDTRRLVSLSNIVSQQLNSYSMAAHDKLVKMNPKFGG